jgi:hypothetical protein
MNRDLHQRFFERLGLEIDFSIIDELVMSDNNILRPIIGHAFEHIFSEIVTDKLNGEIKDEGGDSDIDLIVIDREGNEYTIQVKTLTTASTIECVSFGVSLHKTHGLERNPNNLYPINWPCPFCEHSGGPFPDFLVLPHPDRGVLIVPKNEIPEHNRHTGHFADPAIFAWNSEWINRWDLLGFPEFRGQNLERNQVPRQEILTNVCERVNLTSDELIELWLMPENFRMIDMNLKGNLREPALRHFLLENGVTPILPDISYPKYDIVVNNIRIQVKGASAGLTNPSNGTLGVEVMGSHGRGAIRRYSEGDFDYLGLVIDPTYIPDNLPLDRTHYSFCFIPIVDLPLHYRNTYEWIENDKLYDVSKFRFELQDGEVYLIPDNNYRRPRDYNGIRRNAVCFRNNNRYKINHIPNIFFE